MATFDYTALAQTIKNMVENNDGLNIETRLVPDDGSPALIVNIVQAADLEYWVGLPDDDTDEPEHGNHEAS